MGAQLHEPGAEESVYDQEPPESENERMVSMATEIVKHGQVELLPPTEFKGLAETILDLRHEREILPELLRQAEAIVITDKASYAQCAELLNKIRAVKKQGPLKLDPYKAVAREITLFLQGQLKEHESACGSVDPPTGPEGICSSKQADWNRKERERAQEEQREIQRQKDIENARVAEEKRKNDEAEAKAKRDAAIKEIRAKLARKEITKRQAEKMLRDAGATAEAELEHAAAEAEEKKANPPKVKVEPNTVAVSGQVRRVVYEATVVDPDALIGAFVLTCITSLFPKITAEKKLADAIKKELKTNYLRRFVMPDEGALKREATGTKDSAKLNNAIPGVNFTDKDKV